MAAVSAAQRLTLARIFETLGVQPVWTEIIMGVALFLLSFLVAAITGARFITSFETMPSERFGTEATVLLVGLFAAILSTISSVESLRKLDRRPKWYMGLIGGVIAAGAFLIPVGVGYALTAIDVPPSDVGIWALIVSMIILPTLVGWLWPLVGATAPVLRGSN